MGQKRLIYRTSDGKRHWVPIRLMRLPEGVVFVPAENHDASRTDNQFLPAQSFSAAAARHQPRTDRGMKDKSQRSTIRPEPQPK
jgi:hypothetical protein